MEQTLRTAVFPGTFNPFTIGHKSIVERGLEIFDKIVIAIGHNMTKPVDENIVKRVEAIKKAFEGNSRVEVSVYPGLTPLMPQALVLMQFCVESGISRISNTKGILPILTRISSAWRLFSYSLFRNIHIYQVQWSGNSRPMAMTSPLSYLES